MLSIKSDLYFYLIVYQDSIQFFTNRKDPTGSVHDVITLDFIKAIPDERPSAGGVIDFGDVKEGSCLEIKTIQPINYFTMSHDNHTPVGIDTIWFICLDDKKDKKFLMDLVINMKIKKQHDLGISIKLQSKKSSEHSQSTSSDEKVIIERKTFNDALRSIENEVNDPDRSALDGYWKVLQDWSSCTLSCGGGTQTLQLLCIPPKRDGKNCVGNKIRVKPCNEQPCAEVSDLSAFISGDKSSSSGLGEKIEKTIVKTMSISARPQRYDKCYFKDGFALMDSMDKDTGVAMKLPVRIVMNNKSFAVYADDSLQSNVKSFLLENSNYSRVKNEDTCFMIKANNQQGVFCQLDVNNKAFVDEWGYDFNLFKYQCKQDRRTSSFERAEQSMESQYKEGVSKLKQEMIQKKTLVAKQEVVRNEETELQQKVHKVEQMSVEAIQKELKMEEMLEKEEEEKDRQEEEQLELVIGQEKQKQDCLMKSVREKQLEDQMNIRKIEAEDRIQQIQLKAREQIKINRTILQRKLLDMKSKKERHKHELQKQIMTIKLDTTKNLVKMQRKLSVDTCGTYLDVEKKTAFCKTIDVEDQFECMNLSKQTLPNINKIFCEFCCETNIGSLHQVDREECIKSHCGNITN